MGIKFKPSAPIEGENYAQLMGNIRKHVLLSALRAHFGNVTRTAQTLGVSRTWMYRNMAKHGVHLERTAE